MPELMQQNNSTENYIHLFFDEKEGVKNKKIITSNHFVSHMIEHIAWRLGVAIDLSWNNENWRELGRMLGQEIKALAFTSDEAAALGMIDDGSVEVYIQQNSANPQVTMEVVFDVELDYFLNLRCEQIDSGQSLQDLLDGISKGMEADIYVRICSHEDTHHTWEGLFRAIGIALSKCLEKPNNVQDVCKTRESKTDAPTIQGQGSLDIKDVTATTARVSRKTAESEVEFFIDLKKPAGFKMIEMRVDDSIQDENRCNINDIADFLDGFAKEADLYTEAIFIATKLSSSHVVLEDMGMVIGRAYLEILKVRMELDGANGAGSSVHTKKDFENNQQVRAGISTEGRKFWKFVPYNQSYKDFKKNYLIGHTVHGKLFSEDLDDFFDGFAGGSSSSIIIGIPSADVAVEEMWKQTFSSFGKAVKESLAVNPYRKGLPPGVKATLI